MYKQAISEKYKKYFDVVTSLYLNRKIEKKTEVEKLLKKLSSRGLGPQSAVDLIENKYKLQAPVVGIKEKLKTYHISANVEQRLVFKNRYKPEGYKKSELNQPHLQEKLNLIKETEIIKAKNMQEAQKKVTENIYKKFDSSKKMSIVSIFMM